jgi:diguanylate cyclase (GGDEF)-like protein
MFARGLSPARSLKVRFALSLSIAGAVVALAITILVIARGGRAFEFRDERQVPDNGYDRVWQLQREIFIVGFGTAGAFALIGWLLAGRIAGPLIEIAEAVSRIEQGARNTVIPRREGADELAMLAQSMERMVDSLTRRERELERLAASLEARVVERTAELAQANVRLEELSTTDDLTGVANRRSFDGALDSAWRQAARYGLPLSVIMLDIDHFKGYNDSYGHQAGDDCLRTVATTLALTVTRAGDLVARYGGEEFAVILAHMPQAQAVAIAEKLRGAVEALQIPHAASSVARHLTISLGVASAMPSRETDASALVAGADRALYAAKEGGRNCVAAAGPEESSSWLIAAPEDPRRPQALKPGADIPPWVSADARLPSDDYRR